MKLQLCHRQKRKQILTKRIGILNDLVDKNIHALDDVSEKIQHEYLDRKS